MKRFLLIVSIFMLITSRYLIRGYYHGNLYGGNGGGVMRTLVSRYSHYKNNNNNNNEITSGASSKDRRSIGQDYNHDYGLSSGERRRSGSGSRSTSGSTSSSEVINSATNSKVKLMRSLKLKKKRDELNLVLLEGFRLIQDSIQYGLQPEQILLTEEVVNTKLGESLLSLIYKEKLEQRLSFVSNTIYESLMETTNGPGVIAAVQRPQYTNQLLSLPINNAPLIVLLDRLADPGNAGTLIRSAYGLGVQAICAVESCDLWSPKVLRSAMSASLRLPLYEWKWSETASNLQSLLGEYGQDYQVIVADGRDENLSYHQVDFLKPTVLVIGNEAHGVSQEVKKLPARDIHFTRIPMLRPLESFNAAVAGSIFLAEAASQRSKRNSRT